MSPFSQNCIFVGYMEIITFLKTCTSKHEFKSFSGPLNAVVVQMNGKNTQKI